MGGKVMIYILCVLLIVCLIYIAYQHYNMRCQLKRLDNMLNSAIADTFSNDSFDESMLSLIEARFAQYLLFSCNSRKKINSEKENIKMLVSDISHQLKTPLSNIKLYSELLYEQKLDSQGYKCLDALNSQSEKLSSLIDALVKISRLESGIISLNPQKVNLKQMISRSVLQYIPKAESKNISLNVKNDDLFCICDEKWSEEALCNLLDNAVKYTEKGGKINISTSSYNMFSRIDVSNTAKPISEDEHSKIFTRFYRGKNSYNEQGLGIGLYITRQIMSKQGGYIKLVFDKNGVNTFSLFFANE